MESFRPLGMANAWLTYRLSGNIYLQQILNWFFAVSSFALLFAAVKNKIFFSLLSSVTTVCFFAGYVYLFHLHGVFYGPFQLYVAVLTCIASRKPYLRGGILLATAGLTLIVALYHTFALLVYCAFIAGYAIQLYNNNKKGGYIRLALVLGLTLVLAKIVLGNKEVLSFKSMANGLIMSYRLTEINISISCIALILAGLVIFPVMKTTRAAVIACALLVPVSVLFVYMQLPVLFLWVTLCFVKMIIQKNWVMAGLIAANGILATGSGSGSPTYVVFVLMVCAFVTAEEKIFIIRDSPLLRRLSLLSVLLLFGSVILIKAGNRVPLLILIAKPILSEKEKTQQLNYIVDWKLKNTEYASFSLLLYETWALPVNAKNSIIRATRPVTKQTDLDYYIDFFSRDKPNALKTPALYITFGDQIPEGKNLIFSVKGKWNGKACVFR